MATVEFCLSSGKQTPFISKGILFVQDATGPARQVFEWGGGGGAKDERASQIGVGACLNDKKCIYKEQTKFLFPNVQCFCYRIFKFTITKLKYPLL